MRTRWKNSPESCPENTREATDLWVRTFTKFCAQDEIPLDLRTCSAEELNTALCKFDPALRSKKGEMYKRLSYLHARASISAKKRNVSQADQCAEIAASDSSELSLVV